MHRITHSACLLQSMIILLMMFTLNSARAAELAGHIIMVKGDVTAQVAGGSRRSLKRRDEIYPSDTIRTSAGSRVQIRFIDNALLALQENSQLSIHAYQQADADGKGETVLMELVEGGFRTLTGSIGKGNKEAYRVDTPVASIGIRGTLYSALLTKDQLMAGVWKGGITLSSDQGDFDLGQDADFNFGVLGNHGFQGMLEAPQTLDNADPDAIPDNISTDGTERQDSGNTPPPEPATISPATTALNNTSGDHKVPPPLDQDADSGHEDTLKEAGNLIANPPPDGGGSSDGSDGGPVITSPDLRLSPEEFTAFLASTSVGSIIVNSKAIPVSAFRDERGEPVFVSVDDNNGIDITRYSGTTDSTLLPPELVNIAGIEWGIWNGNAEVPVSQLLNENSLVVTAVESPVMWVIANPALEGTIPTSGSVYFGGTQALGTDSQGNALLSASGNFDLDFATGIVSNGYLSADYADASAGQSIGGNFWNADFTGTIRAGDVNGKNTALVQMQFNAGYHGESSALDTVASQFSGVLVAPSGGIFAGSFNLVDMDGNNAAGIVAWPQQTLLSPQ